MKRAAFAAISLMAVIGCTRESDNIQTPSKERIYASIEQPASTKVYADEELKVLWNEEDLISFFNKLTLNEKWMFMGETGDNAGYFSQVTQAVGTGNELDYYCAVYPYNATTRISNQNVMTLSLPAEQTYVENSFGLGANTMVAVSSSSIFSFKNVCGYLSFKLYGDGVKVKSISLKGNNNERLAGKGTIPLAVGTAPVITMADTATDEITLVCQNAVELNSSASDYTEFWLVVPPVEFTSGFTVTITDENGGTFTKSTSSKLVITRSNIKRMAPIEVEKATPSWAISFEDPAIKTICLNKWDDNGDGELSYVEAAAVTDIGEVFKSKTNITTFEELRFFTGLTSIGNGAFYNCTSLTSITLPEGVTSIEKYAFYNCTSLTSITLPEGVTSIGESAFEKNYSLTNINFPSSLIFIGGYAFFDCISFSVVVPEQLVSLGSQAFCGCIVPDISIPGSLTEIGVNPFRDCSVNSIVVDASNPAYDSRNSCNAIIEKSTAKVITACKNTSLPIGIQSIGSRSFNVKGITSVTIPSSVKAFESNAFYYDITDLYCYPFEKPSGFGSYNNIGTYGYCTLHIPTGCTSEYSFWTGGIQEIEDRVVIDATNGISGDRSYWENIRAVKFTGSVKWNNISWVFYRDYDDDWSYYPKIREVDLSEATIPEQTYTTYDSDGDPVSSGSCSANEIGSGWFYSTPVQSLVLPESIVVADLLINENYYLLSYLEIPSSQVSSVRISSLSKEFILKCNSATPPEISVFTYSQPGAMRTLYAPSSAIDAYASSDWSTYFSEIYAY